MAIFNSYVSLPEGNCYEIKPTNIPRQGLHRFTFHLDMVLIKSSQFFHGRIHPRAYPTMIDTRPKDIAKLTYSVVK